MGILRTLNTEVSTGASRIELGEGLAGEEKRVPARQRGHVPERKQEAGGGRLERRAAPTSQKASVPGSEGKGPPKGRMEEAWRQGCPTF